MDHSRIDRIIDVARGAAPAGPGDRESREAARVPFQALVALVLITPSGERTAPTIATAENIGCGGIRVRCGEELPVGARGAVLVPRSDGEPVVLGATIVSADPAGRRGFVCGLEFETQAPAVALDDFRDAAGNLPRTRPAQAA